MTYAYIRVSTEKQTVKNQKLEIQKFAKEHKLGRVQFTSEVISGIKSYKKRKLNELIEQLNENDTLIVSELSRLGRSLLMIFEILNIISQKKIKLFAIKENLKFDDSIESQVIAFAFGLSAQIERNLISERTKRGLDRIRKEGKRLGRPTSNRGKHKLDNKKALLGGLLKQHTRVECCKILHISPGTLYNYFKEFPKYKEIRRI